MRSHCLWPQGFYTVCLLFALGPFAGSYLRSPLTQWCGTTLTPDSQTGNCARYLLRTHWTTCWVTIDPKLTFTSQKGRSWGAERQALGATEETSRFPSPLKCLLRSFYDGLCKVQRLCVCDPLPLSN